MMLPFGQKSSQDKYFHQIHLAIVQLKGDPSKFYTYWSKWSKVVKHDQNGRLGVEHSRRFFVVLWVIASSPSANFSEIKKKDEKNIALVTIPDGDGMTWPPCTGRSGCKGRRSMP